MISGSSLQSSLQRLNFPDTQSKVTFRTRYNVPSDQNEKSNSVPSIKRDVEYVVGIADFTGPRVLSSSTVNTEQGTQGTKTLKGNCLIEGEKSLIKPLQSKSFHF